MATSRTEFAVGGLDDGDGTAVEEALGELEGVQLVDVDPENGRVEVRYGEELVSEEAIRDAVRDAGYEVE